MPEKNERYRRTQFLIARDFAKIFLPVALMLFIVTLAIHRKEAGYEKNIIKNHEKNKIILLSKMISHDFETVVSDLTILSECKLLREVIKNNSPASRRDLAELFLSFSKREKHYDQIRFIDHRGMEVVRVNYNSGNPVIVSDSKLQNKSHRYYFNDTFKLGYE
jgi:hypothetical protein